VHRRTSALVALLFLTFFVLQEAAGSAGDRIRVKASPGISCAVAAVVVALS
jgi:hypothetical protein